jgi:hypothetical protein
MLQSGIEDRKMNTKITTLIFSAITFLCLSVSWATTGKIIRVLPVVLEKGERIVGMEVQLSGIEVKSVLNIPRDWDIHLHLESQFNQIITGGCGHGASALTSTDELPVFEVDAITAEQQINGSVTLYVVKDFESGKGREVKTKIDGIPASTP